MMVQLHCTLDGTQAAEDTARLAITDAAAKGKSIALTGAVSAPRFDVPSPAIGDRIRRFQRAETQLLRLGREARAAGIDVTLTLPGHEPVRRPERERAAMRPAA